MLMPQHFEVNQSINHLFRPNTTMNIQSLKYEMGIYVIRMKPTGFLNQYKQVKLGKLLSFKILQKIQHRATKLFTLFLCKSICICN